MSIYIKIIITIGIAVSFIGLILKIIEITAEKTADKFIKKINVVK